MNVGLHEHRSTLLTLFEYTVRTESRPSPSPAIIRPEAFLNWESDGSAIGADLGRTRIQTLTATVRPTTNDGRTINLPWSPRGIWIVLSFLPFFFLLQIPGLVPITRAAVKLPASRLCPDPVLGKREWFPCPAHRMYCSAAREWPVTIF